MTAWNVTRSPALEEAERAYARRDYVTAAQRSLDHLSRRPWSHAAALLAARSLSELDQADRAEPYYRWARRTGSLSLDDLHVRAYGWVKLGEIPSAIDAYEEILRRAPDDQKALRRLASIFYSTKQYLRADTLAQRLSRLPGGERVGFALIGSIAHDSQNPSGCVAAYEKVLQLDPDLTSLPFPVKYFWREFALDLTKTGRPDEAIRRLRLATATFDEADLHVVWARAEEALARFDAAEAECRRAIERDPNEADAWLLLGRLALQKHRPEEALDSLKRAEALSPDHLETVYSLSRAYRELGDMKEATRLTKKAEALRGHESSGGSRTVAP